MSPASNATSPRWTLLLGGALVCLMWMSAGCNTTIDPVTSGTLCVPTETECPSGRELSRSGPGTNILDVVIHNRGPRTDVTFDVRFPGLDETADGGDVTMEDTGADAGGPSVGSDIFPQTYTLGRGESVTDRFVPAEIFTRSRLFLELSCQAPDCRVEADYVLLTEQLECQNDGDCSGDRLCSNRLGACVECLRDSDCEDGRDCNLGSGRCLPRPESGCGTAESAPADPIPGALVLVAIFGLYLLARRRRRRTYLTLLAGLGLSTVLLAAPDTSRAAPPLSTLSIGSGPRFVVGELGSDIQPGVGFEIRETLRSRYIGGSAWIETNYFMSRQAAPPLVRETQIFGFGLGPRVFIPIGDFEIVAGGGYRRVGLAPNPFIDRTGDNSNFHAASGTLAVAYQWDRIRFRVYGSYVPIFDLPASLVSVNVSVGFSSGSTR